MNSLPLTPVVIPHATAQEKPFLQVPRESLRDTVALNSYLGFFELCKKLFWLG